MSRNKDIIKIVVSSLQKIIDGAISPKVKIQFIPEKQICIYGNNHKLVEKTHFSIMKEIKTLSIFKREFYRPDKKTIFTYNIKKREYFE